MAIRAIIPSGARAMADKLKMSPGILSGEHVFLTGVTGSDSRGHMPMDQEAQIRSAFNKVGFVLQEANLTFQSIVEMTTYHVGLRVHFDLFNKIRLEYVHDPYPAWTAVEVAGLRREGAIVELRIIASTGANN